MKNHDVVKIVEEALSDLYVVRIGEVSPVELKRGDHPGIPEGKYRIVIVSVAVPDKD